MALLGAMVAIGLLAGTGDVSAQNAGAAPTVELGSSYAEWRQPGALIVDGQKVVVNASTKWKGKFSSLDAVPLVPTDHARRTGRDQELCLVTARAAAAFAWREQDRPRPVQARQ